MNNEFEQNLKNRGEEGALWLKNIPEIIASCEKKWELKVLPPFALTWNYVAPATRSDGTNVVLKIGFPTDKEFKTEIAALEVFNGEGIEKLLEEDKENSVILIERVQPGISLSSLADDEKATRILTHVMKKLWKPLPPKHNFITIRQWSSAIPKLKEKYKDATIPHLPQYLVDKADAFFEELIATSAEPMLVHGDLHQDNILSSDRDEWLAIDPKGIAAEPAYETAAMIRNPYIKMENNRNIKKIMQKRIQIMADELGFDRKRVYKWCLAQTVLSAVWSIEDQEKRWEHSLAVAEALNEIKI